MNNSLISIVIPCYNQAKYLNASILSVYNQTYPYWECIIINDGSTDNSENIAKQWVEKDKRFKYVYKDNNGVSAARNLALEKINGNYIQFLDADDLLDSKKLELSLKLLSKNNDENPKVVISNFKMITSDVGEIIEPYCKLNAELFTFENLLYNWNETFSIPIHCGFFKASIFENIRFPENLTAQEDWIVWVKIFKQNVEALFLNEPLALYRQNPESRTKTKSIYNDQMLAYENFKNILTAEEFHQLSKTLISRYYREQEAYKTRLTQIKKSRTYLTGLMIKKILKFTGTLHLAKRVFPFFLKFRNN